MIEILDTLNGHIDTVLERYSLAIQYGRELDSLISYFNNAHTIYITAIIFFGLLAIACVIVFCRLWICDQKNRNLHIIACLMRTIHKLNVITTTKK